MGADSRFSGMTEPYVHDQIKLGSFLMTIVEPHRGHEVAYNRWYERDHFYAGCMIGPWNLTGGRFVATRDCKELRVDADLFGDPDIGSYLSTALNNTSASGRAACDFTLSPVRIPGNSTFVTVSMYEMSARSTRSRSGAGKTRTSRMTCVSAFASSSTVLEALR